MADAEGGQTEQPFRPELHRIVKGIELERPRQHREMEDNKHSTLVQSRRKNAQLGQKPRNRKGKKESRLESCTQTSFNPCYVLYGQENT